MIQRTPEWLTKSWKALLFGCLLLTYLYNCVRKAQVNKIIFNLKEDMLDEAKLLIKNLLVLYENLSGTIKNDAAADVTKLNEYFSQSK